MMRAVKRHLLDIAAILSLLVGFFLVWGCFGRFDLNVNGRASGGALAAVRLDTVSLDRGRVCLYLYSGAPVSASALAGRHISVHARPFDIRPPDIKRILWEFDAHSLGPFTPGIQVYLLAFPIWCLSLPCLVAPFLWLRRRKRARKQPAGFPLDQATPVIHATT